MVFISVAHPEARNNEWLPYGVGRIVRLAHFAYDHFMQERHGKEAIHYSVHP